MNATLSEGSTSLSESETTEISSADTWVGVMPVATPGSDFCAQVVSRTERPQQPCFWHGIPLYTDR